MMVVGTGGKILPKFCRAVLGSRVLDLGAEKILTARVRRSPRKKN